mgnify:FL=1
MSYVDLGLVHDVESAIRRQGPPDRGVAFVDTVEAAGTDAEVAALRDLLARARAGRGFAVVLCGASAAHLDLYVPDGVVELAVLAEGSIA